MRNCSSKPMVSELPRVSKIKNSGRHLMEPLKIGSADVHIWNLWTWCVAGRHSVLMHLAINGYRLKDLCHTDAHENVLEYAVQ